MKIVYLGLNGRGGTLHYASNLSSEMTNYADTSLLLPSYSDTKLISKKVKLIRIKAPPSPLKTFFLSFNFSMHSKVIKKINSMKPDIINILDIHPWYVCYWHKLKAKKIVTINDPELHSGEAGVIMTFLLRITTKFLLKNADEIIVLGKKQEKMIRKLGYKQRVIISRIGNYGFFNTGKKKFRTDSKTILFFGRIKEYKGLKYLLDAVSQIKEDFKLIIAGEGDYSPYEEKIRKLGRKVETYRGYVSNDKVAELFQKAAFVVMPYKDATQTGIIQVTYSFKKPVIATKVGSLPELVAKNTGILINPRNVHELKKAIESMLKNPKKTVSMGEQAYKFMEKELNWKNIVKKLFGDLNE